MLKSKENQINSLFKGHNEAGHLRLGQCDRITLTNLVNPERNHATTAAHHVPITGAADLCVTRETWFCHGNFLFNGFSDTHSIDRISGLIGWEADDALYTCINSSIQRIICTYHVGLHSLHREELATGHLLQRSSVEHIVNALHRIFQRTLVAHVADVELNLVGYLRHPGREVVTHIVLLLLVAAEDPDLPDVGLQKTVKNCVTETACAASN